MLIDRYHCWVFDMDGTLTVPSHDFDAVRGELGIPEGTHILEHLDTLPESEALPRHERLKEIEWEHARAAKADQAAAILLEQLSSRGCPLGVVTRNSREITRETLRVCGLTEYFAAGAVIAREDALPKPQPDGIRQVVTHLQMPVDQTVMVGDYVHDLLAGKAAGTETIWIDHDGDGKFAEHADHVVNGLQEILRPS